MKWGVRRYQNKDGTLTKTGQKRAAESLSKSLTEDRFRKDAKKNRYVKEAMRQLKPNLKNARDLQKKADDEQRALLGNKELMISKMTTNAKKLHSKLDGDGRYSSDEKKTYHEEIDRDLSSGIRAIQMGSKSARNNPAVIETLRSEYTSDTKLGRAYAASQKAHDQYITQVKSVVNTMLGEFGQTKSKNVNALFSDNKATVETLLEQAIYSEERRRRGL